MGSIGGAFECVLVVQIHVAVRPLLNAWSEPMSVG
jgi:hypothetical protein